jgi:hypothetical protein
MFVSRTVRSRSQCCWQTVRIQNGTGHPIKPFVAKVRGEIAAAKPRIVIIDLRLDQGDPDVRIAYSFADFLAHRDPVLTYVLQEASKTVRERKL